MNWKIWFPQSVLSRLAWVLVTGILLVQFFGNTLWVYQIRQEVLSATEENTDNLADTINNTLRYLSKLPANYRSIALEQLREAGGTRFYMSLHDRPIAVQSLEETKLLDLVVSRMKSQLELEWAPKHIKVNLASPVDLTVRENGTLMTELPSYLNSQHLILSPRPAPLLVVQIELEPGVWAYLAALMPDPFFLDKYQPLTLDRIIFQSFTVFTVLALLFFIVRWITRPMEKLSKAAEKFGRGDSHEALDTAGTREYSKLATAFNLMEERIQRYMDDRERLFRSISHDLRTPITRLKLRTEMLDDEQTILEFEEELDELELMVNGALQTVRDSDIHENHVDTDINKLLLKIIEPMRRAGHEINFVPDNSTPIKAKPLALKRALTNLLDNAVFYGKRVKVTVIQNDAEIQIHIRDYGPGIEGNAEDVFEPYKRLAHGQSKRESGYGLGLNIAQNLIQGHGGSLTLQNHDEGGLIATVILPLA